MRFAVLRNLLHNVMEGELLSPPDPVLRGPCDVPQYSLAISMRFVYINPYLHVNISECVLILI